MNIEMVYKSLILVLVLFIGWGCKNIVERYDERLSNQYTNAGFVQKTMKSDRFSINYWDNQKKDAPVVVFVHGFGGDGKISWWEQAEVFQEDYRVVVPDILWFGKSQSSVQPTLNAQIDGINKLLQHLSLEKVHLVGISYGGFISLGIAHRYSDQLRTLTLVDSPGPVVSAKDIDNFCEQVGVDSIQEAFVPESAEGVKRLMDFSFEQPPLLTDGIRAQTLGRYFSRYPKEQRELLRDLPSNRQALSGPIAVETLILWGKEDAIFDVHQARELAELLSARIEIIEGAGHALPFERPRAFNEQLEKFIQTSEE